MAGIPFRYREAFARLRRATVHLDGLIESGEFHSLGYLERRKLLRRIRRLYNRIVGPVSPAVVGSAVAAVGILTLAGCRPGIGYVPSFAAPVVNPFGLGTVNAYDPFYAGPTVFADIDGDGDLDLFLTFGYSVEGVYTGVAMLENTGTPSVPAFGDMQGIPEAMVGDYAQVLAAGDIDGDGDIDLITHDYEYDAGYGQVMGFLYYVENTDIDSDGTIDGPAFRPAARLVEEPSEPRTAGLMDLEGDGDLDLITWERPYLFEFRNESAGGVISFAGQGADPVGFPDIGTLFPTNSMYVDSVTFADVDGDGDLDIVVAGTDTFDYNSAAFVGLLINSGDDTPSFEAADVQGLTVPGTGYWGYSRLYRSELSFTGVDLDSDGDTDIMAGPLVEREWVSTGVYDYINSSTFYFLENTADPLAE